MGVPMAANLARAGFAVQSYDMRGNGTHASVRQAVEGADILLTMLPDGDAVREVVLEALPALKPGALVIDMSSSDPAATLALGVALAAKDISLVDAPVSGALPKAKDATLAIMVGGSPADVARARPVLEKLGTEIFHVGPLGAGHVVKALNNYLGAAGTLAGFEALLMARAFGLEPKPMLDAINASTGRNWTTERKIPLQVLTGAFASGFKLALMTKDVGIAADLAKALGVQTPYLRETLRLWRDAAKKMPAQADHTEIYRYLERLTTPSRGAPAPRAKPRRKPRRSSAAPGRRRPAAAASSRARGRAAARPARGNRRRA
jgi:3-hydroxyisobutyrate dehydrogenase